mgnify:CR=1 FL=1
MGNLILTRKKKESIILYRDNASNDVLCEIVILALGNRQVKLAFEADPNIKIDRKEIYDEKN